MKITKQTNDAKINCYVPDCVKSHKDFGRYMMAITGAGELEARNMRYFLKFSSSYTISRNGVFWVFLK